MGRPSRSRTSRGIIRRHTRRHKRSSWRTQLLRRSQADPVWWIRSVLGGSLWQKQIEIANSVVSNERTAVPASFGVGKTWLAARMALWFLYCHQPAKVITTAPTARQVKDLLWSELRSAHRDARFPLGGDPLTLQLHVQEDQYAIGFSTKDYNIDFFTGYHSPHQFVVFDQASGLPNVFWHAAEGLMTSGHSRWLAIGNTAISTGEFANICMPERQSKSGEWNIIPIQAWDHPNVEAGEELIPGSVTKQWVDQRLKAWGELDPLYRIFVRAEFVPAVEMTIVPYDLMQLMFKSTGEKSDEIEIGLDVARQGMDSTFMFARSGSAALEGKRLTGNDTMQVVKAVREFRDYLQKRHKKPVTSIKVDTIGVGAGVYDRLAELDEPVVDVNNAEAAFDKERFANCRAEMAWAFRERLERQDCGLADFEVEDPEILDMLEEDIRKMRYKINTAGKILLVDKEELRKDLGRSPDYWDAMIMAYEQPGGGAPAIAMINTGTDGIVSSDLIQGAGNITDLFNPDRPLADELFEEF